MKFLIVLLTFLYSLVLGASATPKHCEASSGTPPVSFTENKGQVHDQNNKARPDIIFSGIAGDLVFHLKTTGISYQLTKIEGWKEKESPKFKQIHKVPAEAIIDRLDINWLHSNNKPKVIPDESLPGYNNYYSESCPDGALNVTSYKGVTYKNIYPGIDVHYYGKNGHLKYDYLVAPFANYKNIQLKVNGAEQIELKSDGSMVLKTSLGTLTEAAPLVYQGKRKLEAKWILHDEVLSFSLKNYDPALPLVIDPLVRIWGTYYGGASTDYGMACATDASGNSFLAGYTNSTTFSLIATSGAHQVVFTGAPNTDAFLVKFNASGARLWGTYYGGGNEEFAYGCATDKYGRVYICGQTSTTLSPVIATPGSHQYIFNQYFYNYFDAFIVKFSSSGSRLWGSYYGGQSDDCGYSCTVDAQGNVLMAGQTSSSVGIASAGAYQSTLCAIFPSSKPDAFLIKFDSLGTRLWGTYYGGDMPDIGYGCAADNSGNVFLCGGAESTSNIATPVSYQSTSVGGPFLVKFSANGVRQWATYYGNSGEAKSCATSRSGDVFVAGWSNQLSTPANPNYLVASPGAFQQYPGGNRDAFLVRFSGSGQRYWGTYCGGDFPDEASDCAVDIAGNVFMGGYSEGSYTNNEIASQGSYQPVKGGIYNDGWFAKFNNNGAREWGSYYGGSGYAEAVNSCDVDTIGNLYIAGHSDSPTNISSIGSFKSNYGGNGDAFLAKFYECIAYIPLNATTFSNISICPGNATTLTALSQNPVTWYATATSTNALSTGSTYVTPTLTAGTFNFFAQTTSTCSSNVNRLTITVSATSPTLSVAGNTIVCAGTAIIQTASGTAITYTWSNGLTGNPVTFSPTASSVYTITGTDSRSCSASITRSITAKALPSLTITSTDSLICEGEKVTLTVSGAASYTWNTNSYLVQQVVSPVVTTNYIVIGINPNYCTNTASFTQSVAACESIHEMSGTGQKLMIYPNPNSGNFLIDTDKPVEISIYNSMGQLISSQELTGGTNKINMVEHAAGLYFVRFLNNENGAGIKVIKQ